MFNTDVSNNQSIKINAVTGAILKNHNKSWFERFNLQSNLAGKYLQAGGHRASPYKETDNNDVIILQLLICGDMEAIAECVYRKDYEAKEEPK